MDSPSVPGKKALDKPSGPILVRTTGGELKNKSPEIIDGDLRPLYLAQPVMECDGEQDP